MKASSRSSRLSILSAVLALLPWLSCGAIVVAALRTEDWFGVRQPSPVDGLLRVTPALLALSALVAVVLGIAALRENTPRPGLARFGIALGLVFFGGLVLMRLGAW